MSINAAIQNATSLDELLAALRSHDTRDADLSDLPAFGGETPARTEGVWSWDEDRLLVGEGELEIVTRAAWDAR